LGLVPITQRIGSRLLLAGLLSTACQAVPPVPGTGEARADPVVPLPDYTGDPDAQERLGPLLEAAVRATEVFGPLPPGPWTLALHGTDADFERATGAPPGRAAAWVGATLHLRPWLRLRQRDPGALLRHELTHRRLRALGLARWREEASCLWAEGHTRPPAPWPADPPAITQVWLDRALAGGTTATQLAAYRWLRAWLQGEASSSPPSAPGSEAAPRVPAGEPWIADPPGALPDADLPAGDPAKAQRPAEDPPRAERPNGGPARVERTAEDPARVERTAEDPARVERPAEDPPRAERPTGDPARVERPAEDPSTGEGSAQAVGADPAAVRTVRVTWPPERMPRALVVQGEPLAWRPGLTRYWRGTVRFGPGAPVALLEGEVGLRAGSRGWSLTWTLSAETWIAAATAGELGEDAPVEAKRALGAVLALWLRAHPQGNHPDGTFCPLTHCAVVRGQPSAATRAAVARRPRLDLDPRWAFFTSSCGGVALSPRAVWGAGPDQAGTVLRVPGDRWADWERTLSAAQVAALKAAVPPGLAPGQAGLRLGASGPYPVERLRLEAGRRFGWTIWPSNACTGTVDAGGVLHLSGHGLGHNTGLCLATARYRALAGASAEAILAQAFPEAR
jgi:hypothetical protein